jgi:endonuclease YncB( thermonuclease family)
MTWASALVGAGLSAIFVRDGQTFARQSQYKALEAQAQSDRTGSWGVCDGGPETDG